MNTGGGLGVRFRQTDSGLDVVAWAQALARQLGDLDVIVGTEPGEYLAKHLATLLAEVVTVEDRGQDRVFIGLDAGWSTVNESFVYRIPFQPILCRAADDIADPALHGDRPHQRGQRHLRHRRRRCPRCGRAT